MGKAVAGPQSAFGQEPERNVPTDDVTVDQPPEPDSFGHYLLAARQAKGLSLDELAFQTKVRRTILEALESGARRELPEKVFVLGYVRSYAGALGLPVEDAARRFLASWQEDEPGAPAEEEGRGISLAWVPPALAALFAAGVFWFITHMH